MRYRVVYQYHPGLRWLGRDRGKVNDYVKEEPSTILRVHWTNSVATKGEAIELAERMASGMLFRVGIMKVNTE